MPNPDRTNSLWTPGSESSLVTRRHVLGGIAGVAGLAAFPSLLAACGTGESATTTGAAEAGGVVTFGSNYSDAVPKAAMQAVVDGFAAESGITMTVNTIDHGTFQDQISAYLQGTPDDVFTWFAGFRMRFFAAQGLSTDISDVWSRISGNYSDAFKTASTGDDGKQYFVPFYNYPWVVIYRKSLFEANGYTVPTNWDEFTALAGQIQSDGLIPLAFGDKDGWPAMGTFDILNMRLNGYDFHVGLMAGTEKWTDDRTKAVFEKWRDVVPFLQEGALGRTWQDAAQSMINQDAAMYFLGTFAGEQATDPAIRDDLDFFAYPVLGTDFDAEMGIDAPIDGFMLSKEPANPEGAKAFIEYLATGSAQNIFVAESPNNVAAANDADTSGYSAFQKKMAEIIGSSGRIAQFLDRDSRPDFSGPNGMQLFLQNFLTDPDLDLDPYLTTVQDFWDSLA